MYKNESAREMKQDRNKGTNVSYINVNLSSRDHRYYLYIDRCVVRLVE